MALKEWFMGLFDKGTKTLRLDAQIGYLATDVFYKKLAIEAAINLIAGTLSQAEFKTFENGKPVRKNNYYLLNVEPNPNKNATRFWRDVISRLVHSNKALVVQSGGYFYCAENFTVKRFAFRDYIFDDIRVDGYELDATYSSPEVLYFELNNEKITLLIEGLYSSYGKLITASQNHYKRNNARRGILEIPTNYPKTDEARKELENLLNKGFKRWMEAENGALLPLTKGEKYEEPASNIGIKGGIEGRDIRNFVDDIFDFVAIAFQIPPALLKGQVADSKDAMERFLTFCVNPIAKIINNEVNRKYYGKKDYLNRTYAKLDTFMLKAVDIKDVAGALDILLRTGTFTIDDCLELLGMEPIGGELGGQRFITKNYEPLEQALGGE